mmetsp:Transcript_33099/g.77461  ORF Transcript_33099/g.77461 Transcript_33099/m.77461 type:complete len:320 (-) Transcript_33099:64-1023(-)
MPHEVVNEQVWQQRRVRICARCRRELPPVVQHRGAYNTAGSVAGSLGTSMGGSMLLGAALGPVGAIGGAIGGAIVGSRAGAAASQGVCDAVESTADDLCDDCKAASSKATPARDWGGGRLGTTSAPSTDTRASTASTARGEAAGQEASTGERISEAASAAGEKIGEAANAAGEKISEGWSWMRKSVSSAFGGGDAEDANTASSSSASKSAGPKAASGGSFAAFSGSGHVLGARDDGEASRPRANPSRLLGDPSGGPPARPRPSPPSAAATVAASGQGAEAAQAASCGDSMSQMEADEALARQLQEEEERALRDETPGAR